MHGGGLQCCFSFTQEPRQVRSNQILFYRKLNMLIYDTVSYLADPQLSIITVNKNKNVSLFLQNTTLAKKVITDEPHSMILS